VYMAGWCSEQSTLHRQDHNIRLSGP